jgi:hypothetical protein
MSTALLGLLVLLLGVSQVEAQDKATKDESGAPATVASDTSTAPNAVTNDSGESDTPQTPAELYKAIVADRLAAQQAYSGRYQAAETEKEKKKISGDYPSVAPFAKRMLRLAQDHPNDPAAFDALVWIVDLGLTCPTDTQTNAVQILIQDHIEDEKLGDVCNRWVPSLTKPPQLLLQALMEKHPDRDVKAKATYDLARSLKLQAGAPATYGNLDDETTARIRKMFGEETFRYLLESDPEPLLARTQTLLEEVIADYSDMKYGSRTLGELAERDLFEVVHLAVGKVAPDIKGEDIEGVVFKLSDYRGKVVVLDFWGNW